MECWVEGGMDIETYFFTYSGILCTYLCVFVYVSICASMYVATLTGAKAVREGSRR